MPCQRSDRWTVAPNGNSLLILLFWKMPHFPQNDLIIHLPNNALWRFFIFAPMFVFYHFKNQFQSVWSGTPQGLGLHLLSSLLIVHWLSLCLFRAFACFWILLFAFWLLYGVFYNLDIASFQVFFFPITYVISFYQLLPLLCRHILLDLYSIGVGLLPAPMYVHHACVSPQRSEMVSGFLKLELQVAVSYNVSAGIWTLVLCKSNKCS